MNIFAPKVILGNNFGPKIFLQKIFADKNVLLDFDTEDPSLVQFAYIFLQVKDCTNSRIMRGSSTYNASKTFS